MYPPINADFKGNLKTAKAVRDRNRERVGSKEMKLSVIIALVIIVAFTAGIIVLESGLLTVTAPIEQREDRTTYTPNQNVAIEATTFNGNIEIQPTTGSQIEVIYTIKAPQGHLYDIKTSTNETKSQNQTTILTSAKNPAVDASSVNHLASLILKLPATSQYNLTLITGNGDIIKPQLNDINVTASTTNGNINITDDKNGNIEAISMNGNIRIDLAKGTLFQVAASVGNGNIAYPGIALNTTIQSATRLKGATSDGEGNLSLTLMSANGNITLEYSPQ